LDAGLIDEGVMAETHTTGGGLSEYDRSCGGGKYGLIRGGCILRGLIARIAR